MHPEEGKNMGTEGATVISATRPVRWGPDHLGQPSNVKHMACALKHFNLFLSHNAAHFASSANLYPKCLALMVSSPAVK